MFLKKKSKNLTGRIVVGEGAQAGRYGYDRLRDNVLFMNADGNTKVLQIESAVSGEGKTTTVCNLAVCLGKAGKKAAVLELDFYHPRVHRVFKLPGATGIAEYMLGSAGMDEVIKKTGYENVDIITRGGAIDNPPLVYMSEKFKGFMAALREKYDFLLLDCAPVLQSSDFMHISEVSDGVLFLAAHARTTRSQAEDAVRELKKNGIPVLGAVFTMYKPKKSLDYMPYKYYSTDGEPPESFAKGSGNSGKG